MVLGYKCHNGKYLPLTRMSNTVDVIYPQNLDIENNVFIWHHSILECSNGIKIEEGCQIGAYVLMASHSSHLAIRLYGTHFIEHNGKHKAYVRGSIKIGKFSFVGPHSVIMPGTSIGKGSIVSAYSLVKGEFPDFAIIAGNPAVQVGDTRKTDEKMLQQYPELRKYYDEWAN
ncbi:MAG: acyltransferase [Burkholderiales bacterium]|nr:acyltransferase [Burkholderiales bacterium]